MLSIPTLPYILQRQPTAASRSQTVPKIKSSAHDLEPLVVEDQTRLSDMPLTLTPCSQFLHERHKTRLNALQQLRAFNRKFSSDIRSLVLPIIYSPSN